MKGRSGAPFVVRSDGMTLEEIKHALRIDHNFDDDWIMELKGSAEDYIKDAVTLSPNRDAFLKTIPGLTCQIPCGSLV